MSKSTRRNNAAASNDGLGAGRRRILLNDSNSSSNSSSSDEEMTSSKVKKEGAKFAFKKPQNASARRNAGSSHSQRSQNNLPHTQSQNSRNRRNVIDEEIVDEFLETRELSEEEMIKNTLEYLFLQQRSLNPVRKSDIIKLAMNKQTKDFRNIIMAVSDVLLDVFGLKLVGMKCLDDVGFQKCDIEDAVNFILVSKFRQGVPMVVTPEDSVSSDVVQAGLLLILASTYMLEKQLDEDTIWEIFESMEFSEQICKRREDFKRFLKTKYVDTMYLTRTEIKDVDYATVRYDWGFRAQQEITKYALLKFVSQQLHGKDPKEFPMQFSKIPRKEVELVDEEDERISLKHDMLGTFTEQVNTTVSDHDTDDEMDGNAAPNEAS